MKFIAFILSIFIFSISMMPCPDGLSCEIENVHHDNDHQHEHSEDGENDACSPFCYCGCCSIPVTLTEFELFVEEKSETPSSYEFSYQKINTIDYPSSVWQPPKHS